MVLNIILAALASLSLALALWQFVVAMRFPLHQRVADKSFTPPVTLLKPLKGADAETLRCLESWLTQDYAGAVQILFGVESATARWVRSGTPDSLLRNLARWFQEGTSPTG